MTFRNLARVGATGLLAAGSLAFAAVPAFAADVDFGVDLKGTTIAADASGKLGIVTIVNDGTTTPSEVEVLFDTSKLDTTKVKAVGLDQCTVDGDATDCTLDPVPLPGESAKLPIPLIKEDGATGAAGSITVTVKVAGDTNPDNNSKTVDVTVGGNGVDLTLVANDVYQLSKDESSFEAIPPGGQGLLTAFILNQGDAVAKGLKIGFSLPKDVSITDDLEGCTLSADRRSADCTIEDLTLVPLDQDQNGDNSTIGLGVAVTVSKDAPGPVVLKGGEMAVAAIDQEVVSEKQMQTMARRAPAALPKGFHHLTADELKAVEVDATDNTDTFAVFVAAPQGGTGGGGGGGDNGGGDNGGGLPVTGPVAASVAGVGGAVIVIGAALFFVARRRRVVVVTPSNDK